LSGNTHRIADKELVYFLTFTVIHWIDERQMIVQYPQEYLFSSAVDNTDGNGIVNSTKIQA